MSHKTRFFVVPTAHTEAWIATRTPDWGEHLDVNMTGDLLVGLLRPQNTYWRELPDVLMHRLATHPRRSQRLGEGHFCVVGGRSLHMQKPHCDEDWYSMCPGKLLVLVEQVPDPDYAGYMLCPTAWNASRCRLGGDRLLRIVGSPAGVLRRPYLASCPHLSVPWLTKCATTHATY